MATPVLSTPLVLEAPERSIDAGGGVDVAWAALGTLWAELQPVSAAEPEVGGREAPRVSHRITVRAAPIDSPQRPRPECRFRLGARVFAIRGVAASDHRHRYLTCWAEEGAFS